MARILTTPELQPNAIQQAISAMRYEIPHVRNVGDTAMEFSKPQIHVWYEVITYAADGAIIKKATRSVPLADWPSGFQIDVKGAYDRLYADAEAAGLIAGPGTDEALE
jgi:hypothetical protein